MVHPVVNVKQGWLRGTETKSEVGGSYLSFKGIPYAQPPVGDLRFKDPQPPQPWSGVRQALTEKPQCTQLDIISHEIEGEEDCLYLNVSTTSLQGSRPVMVWIHGGGFMWGNGGTDFYGPDYLVQKDIVFVNINYRLGVFGFLSLDHEIAPGNMGLKDQVAGLKWVKENIAQFGGDPNNVTIFGESAGGASVHYHLLSPLSKGLFHKAIAQSGVALNPWATAFDAVGLVHRLLAHLGNDSKDPTEILKFLRTIPANDLAEAQQNILTAEEKDCFVLPFVPCVDSKSREPFLPHPVQKVAVETQDVPLLLGYNSHEGAIAGWTFTKDVNQNVDVGLSCILRGFPLSKMSEAAKRIKKFYFGAEKVTEDMTDQYTRYASDCLFITGIQKVVDSRANKKSPTYLYRFSHNAPHRLSTVLWENNIKGAAHFDEIAYLFYPSINDGTFRIEPGSIEQVISERFIRFWTDFAKTGDPTPRLDDLITTKWEPVTSTTKNYLAIDAELSTGVNPDEDIYQFWKGIHEIENNQCSELEYTNEKVE